MTSGKSDLIDVDAVRLHETKLAVLLADGARQDWFPKAQVEDNGDGTWAMPEWLAMEKGFI